jgi:hypothetical protein
MLFYSPPFLMVDQVTVFPDHADPEAFYYIVAVPELVVEEGEPAFWATAILPPASVGTDTPGQQAVGRALVSLDINLPLPKNSEETLRKEIQKRWGREPKRLTPATLQNGKASLSVARPSGTDPSKEFFVYEGHAPTLINDNRAAFAIAAEGKEAQALIAAMSVGQLAAVVTYELEFPGLAPSFEARMVVHWSMVYQRFRQHDMTNFIFVSDEIDKTIEQLKQSSAIEVDVKELDPEVKTTATRALFDELKSQVMKKLFESPKPSGDVPIEERIGRGVRDVLTSVLPGVSHSLRTLDQSFLTDTTIDLHEQDVKTYRFYPQSTLAGLLHRAGGAASRLAFVRVEDLPHRIEEVLVEMAGGSQRMGVRSVRVRVQALATGRDEPLVDSTVTLDATKPERQSVRFRRLGTEEPVVRYQAEMVVDPALAPNGKERWTFDWQPVKGNRIWFDPEEWLDVSEVRLEIDDPAVFDTARVDMDVEALLAGDSAPMRKTTFRFSKEAPSQVFTVIVPDGKLAKFRGTETFRRVGELDFTHAVPEISGSVHRIMNPFGQSWTMEVRAISSWTDTVELFAEFRVWDVLRQSWLRSEQQFQKTSPVFTLKFSTSLETPRKAEARATRIGSDGKIVRGPWKDIAGPIAAITDDVKAQRRIRVTLSAPHFKRVAVQKVFAEIEYDDADHNLHEITDPPLEFTHDQGVADWTHTFPDPAKPMYRFRVRARSEDGERYAGKWTENGEDDLTITLPQNPWSQ